jgi:hypothetical protein
VPCANRDRRARFLARGEGYANRMGYVIAAILVLLIVAGFVTFLVMNSMRKGAGGQGSDPSADQSGRGGPPGVGQDETPLGDTTEHAGSQSESGATADDPEGAARGVDPSSDEAPEGGEGPSRPDRPENRQLRDAGARD